ncbi:hypothetical protein ABZZ20_36360 [Streptomyces sp. NPDC006430]|uniref:hypothetical protein n=1 Tax=Streptomyces sp. NPDC006430 TaxID=3154299 RepID=UPI0033BA28AF
MSKSKSMSKSMSMSVPGSQGSAGATSDIPPAWPAEVRPARPAPNISLPVPNGCRAAPPPPDEELSSRAAAACPSLGSASTVR